MMIFTKSLFVHNAVALCHAARYGTVGWKVEEPPPCTRLWRCLLTLPEGNVVRELPPCEAAIPDTLLLGCGTLTGDCADPVFELSHRS